jgi:MSHA biogenesis protein MshG
MDTFDYKGRNKRGEIMHGSIESPNVQGVANWMLASGIAPIHIQVRENKLRGQPNWLRALQVGESVKLVDLLLFTRQMGTMVRAGVPIMQALTGIQKSTGNHALADVIKDVRTDLDKGLELSSAMAQHPKVFTDYYVSMVRVGEGTGQLEEVFKRLFEQFVFDDHMQKKVKGALRYPSFVMIALGIAITILTIFVIPTFAQIFTSMKLDLPLLTRLLLGVSGFAVNYWWMVLGGATAIGYSFRLYTRMPEGRYQWDRLKLHFPVVGSIIKKATLARFCRSFATASKSGVPVVQAFTLVSRVVNNAFYEERILGMRNGVERGENMLRVSQSAGIFSPIELQMIAVGEETGDIDGMLNQVADMHQEEVEYEVDRLSEAIEPILLVVMGVLVGILLLGIFMPMWDMTKLAHQQP